MEGWRGRGREGEGTRVESLWECFACLWHRPDPVKKKKKKKKTSPDGDGPYHPEITGGHLNIPAALLVLTTMNRAMLKRVMDQISGRSGMDQARGHH